MQATLDQFLACIEDIDPSQRPVALVDFLLATTALGHQLQRGGTPLSALQLLAMQAVTEAGINDEADPGSDAESDAQTDPNGRAPGQAPKRQDREVWHISAPQGGASPCPQASGAPAPPFGLAEVKALLVDRMEAVRRAQMLAGADTSGPHPQAVDSMRFAMLPLLVLNAHRPRPPLHRRIAADRTDLLQAGLALARDGQAPGPLNRNHTVPEDGQVAGGLHPQRGDAPGGTGRADHEHDRGGTGDP